MSDFTWEELESERLQSSRYPADRMPFSRTFRKRTRDSQHLRGATGAKPLHHTEADDNYLNRFFSS
jgi:hypothetical protein